MSVLGENCFEFPEPVELTTKLKDVLEDDVDEKYYLSDEQVASFVASTERAKAKGNGFRFAPIERERERESNGCGNHESRESADRQLHQGIVGRVEAINGHDILKRVYGTDGTAPTLSTMGGGNTEPFIVASRGRDPMNPSNRTKGSPTVQRLEPNLGGVTNTITSVQKDNYVVEPSGGVAIMDDIYKNREPRVYPNHAPTLRAYHAGDLKVVPIRTANSKGYDLATDGDGIDLAYPQSKTRRGRVGHGVSKTIPTGGGGEIVWEH